MQIPNTFKIKNSEHILLLITGKQEASFHKVFNGEMTTLNSFKVDKPHYSDNEGHFKTRADGRVIRSGSPRELDDDLVIADFLKKLEKYIKTDIDTDDYSQIYLTVPGHLKNIIVDSLPPKITDKIHHEILGNFFNEEPLGVLERFSDLNIEEGSESISFIGKEAKQILKKTKQARKVIKGDPKD